MANSPNLSQEQKDLVMRRQANRIGKDGVLRVTSQETRSQAANRELAVERFTELLRDALKQFPIRKKTRVSKAATLKRLDEKRQRSTLKHGKSQRIPVEEERHR